MDHIKEFATDLEGAFKWNDRTGWKLDYYPGAGWIRIYFNSDRTILRDNVNKIETLLLPYNLSGDFNTSWTWTHRYYNGLEFNNDDVTYALFITPSKELYKPVTINISDTTDELYDIGLFSYRNAMVKNGFPVAEFSNYSRTDYGYNLVFYTKSHALEFYKQNPFNRIMNIVEGFELGKKLWLCDIYMNDKIPDPIPVVKIESSKRKKIINNNSSNLVKSALSKLTAAEQDALKQLFYEEL